MVGGRLETLVGCFAIGRRTMRITRQNLAWAFAYNVIAIPLAAFGWVTPWAAGLGMAASSLFVVLNALRLRAADTSHPSHRPDIAPAPAEV
jgi:Cu2+-exporting ATPase